MYDQSSVTQWENSYQEWVPFGKSMMKEGKGKEAFSKYPWFTTEGEPFATLAAPASETRFGLVTTGGYFIDGEQEPMSFSFGDKAPQINRIPLGVDRSKLKIKHPGYDHRFAKEDLNANLPFDRLQELVADGTIGSLAEETVVLMGLQPNVSPLVSETIPNIIEGFRADNVEAALLVPS